jgi:hypothetical protein
MRVRDAGVSTQLRYRGAEMSSEPVHPVESTSLELPVEELLRRARPLPPHEEMVIEDLDEAETAAFLALLKK